MEKEVVDGSESKIAGKSTGAGKEKSPSFSGKQKTAEPSSVHELAETLAEAFKAVTVSNVAASSTAAARNVKPPRVYSIGNNFKTWLSQFTQYMKLVRAKEEEKKGFLLTLLDQPAFRAVELLRLPEELPFNEFTVRLISRFDSGKSKEDYKLQLRARQQRNTEDIDAFADSVMELVENAYPDIDYSVKVELAKDHFIQGVNISEEMRERLFISEPSTLADAVRKVHQIQSAHKVCKSTQGRSSKSVNAVSGAGEDKTRAEIRELKELVLAMNNKIQDLEGKLASKPNRAPRRATVQCFKCQSFGHYARECPLVSRIKGRNESGNMEGGLPRGSQVPRN